MVATGSLAWHTGHGPARDLRAMFTPEHVSFLRMYDTLGQQTAHRVMVLATAASALAGACAGAGMRSAPSLSAIRRRIDAASGPIIAVVLVVLFHDYFRWLPRTTLVFLLGGTFSMGVLPSPRLYVVAQIVGAGGTIAAARFSGAIASRQVRRWIWAALGLYAAVLTVPALFETPDLSGLSGELLHIMEWHYSGVIGPGDRLAAGQRLFSEVRLYSGPLLVTLLAIAERVFGHLDLANHIRSVQVMQLAFVYFTPAQLDHLYARQAENMAGVPLASRQATQSGY